jgi:nitrate reductase cytochrome c-type subunit
MDAKNYSRPAMYVIHSMLRHTAFNEIELILFLEKLKREDEGEKKSPRPQLRPFRGRQGRPHLSFAAQRPLAPHSVTAEMYANALPIIQKWQEQR